VANEVFTHLLRLLKLHNVSNKSQTRPSETALSASSIMWSQRRSL